MCRLPPFHLDAKSRPAESARTPFGAASDRWALGAIVFERTGRPGAAEIRFERIRPGSRGLPNAPSKRHQSPFTRAVVVVNPCDSPLAPGDEEVNAVDRIELIPLDFASNLDLTDISDRLHLAIPRFRALRGITQRVLPREVVLRGKTTTGAPDRRSDRQESVDTG